MPIVFDQGLNKQIYKSKSTNIGGRNDLKNLFKRYLKYLFDPDIKIYDYSSQNIVFKIVTKENSIFYCKIEEMTDSKSAMKNMDLKNKLKSITCELMTGDNFRPKFKFLDCIEENITRELSHKVDGVEENTNYDNLYPVNDVYSYELSKDITENTKDLGNVLLHLWKFKAN